MNFAPVQNIATAILYEGYILYPYRPSAIKNRQRWNFGTLYPRGYAEAQHPQEPFRFVAECLVEAGADEAMLDLKIQFLQLVRKQNDSAALPDDALHRLSSPSLGWDEAVECNAEQSNLRLDDLINFPLTLAPQIHAVGMPGDLSDTSQQELLAMLKIGVELLPSGARKLRLEVENASLLLHGAASRRDEALPLSFVSAHVLLGITGGKFISLLDPAGIYCEAVAGCSNVGVFPVLAGKEPDRTIMLCSPIILYDYPKIAPESAGDFFDGTEMDEMLTLRVLTLTDAEKEEMRNGDPRAKKILERTEARANELLMKSHGTIREMRGIGENTP